MEILDISSTTDWISALTAVGQLLVTSVGFWLLYTTFVLQAKVATDQQKMLEIENRRVRREIRPVFKVDDTYTEPIPGYTRIQFYCELNDAYNVHMLSNSGSNVILWENDITMPLAKKDMLYSIDYAFLRPPKDSFSSENRINIQLRFEDVDGFPYTQLITGTHSAITTGRPIPTW